MQELPVAAMAAELPGIAEQHQQQKQADPSHQEPIAGNSHQTARFGTMRRAIDVDLSCLNTVHVPSDQSLTPTDAISPYQTLPKPSSARPLPPASAPAAAPAPVMPVRNGVDRAKQKKIQSCGPTEIATVGRSSSSSLAAPSVLQSNGISHASSVSSSTATPAIADAPPSATAPVAGPSSSVDSTRNSRLSTKSKSKSKSTPIEPREPSKRLPIRFATKSSTQGMSVDVRDLQEMAMEYFEREAFEPDQRDDEQLAVIHLTTRPWSEIKGDVKRSSREPTWWTAEPPHNAQTDPNGKGKRKAIQTDPELALQWGFRRANEVDDLEDGAGKEDKRRTRGIAHMTIPTEDTSDARYAALHRKFEIQEAKIRHQEGEKIAHAKHKLKQRLEMLQGMSEGEWEAHLRKFVNQSNRWDRTQKRDLQRSKAEAEVKVVSTTATAPIASTSSGHETRTRLAVDEEVQRGREILMMGAQLLERMGAGAVRNKLLQEGYELYEKYDKVSQRPAPRANQSRPLAATASPEPELTRAKRKAEATSSQAATQPPSLGPTSKRARASILRVTRGTLQDDAVELPSMLARPASRAADRSSARRQQAAADELERGTNGDAATAGVAPEASSSRSVRDQRAAGDQPARQDSTRKPLPNQHAHEPSARPAVIEDAARRRMERYNEMIAAKEGKSVRASGRQQVTLPFGFPTPAGLKINVDFDPDAHVLNGGLRILGKPLFPVIEEGWHPTEARQGARFTAIKDEEQQHL